MPHLFEVTIYFTLGTMWGQLIHIYEAHLKTGKHSPPMVDAPVFTDRGNVDSMSREEPSKTVTFCEDLGHPYNIDDSV